MLKWTRFNRRSTVAILVWAIGLSLGGTTGYAINPAEGPRIVHSTPLLKEIVTGAMLGSHIGLS
jgi:glycerol uptake facilitator protein